MHLLAAASVELSARTGLTSGAAPVKARPASPAFRGAARAPPFVGCCFDRTGLGGVSPQDAPLFEIDDPSGETEPTTIGHGGAFQSPQWQAVFPTGRLRCPATGWKLARLKLRSEILEFCTIASSDRRDPRTANPDIVPIFAERRANKDRTDAPCAPRGPTPLLRDRLWRPTEACVASLSVPLNGHPYQQSHTAGHHEDDR
jgi:hypothetical protein